jgi:5-methylthioribose kinase
MIQRTSLQIDSPISSKDAHTKTKQNSRQDKATSTLQCLLLIDKMTGVTEAKILTEETVPAYLVEQHSDKLDSIFPSNSKVTDASLLKATAIQGGNVNYAFAVTCPNNPSVPPVFVKQAPEFVAIFGPDGFPLTSDRMQMEMDVYEEWKQLLGPELSAKNLPKIHFFDSKSGLI